MKKKDFFDQSKHGRFLSIYGSENGKAWKSFLNLLENQSRKEDEVVDGAVEAFELFQSAILSVRREIL